MYTEMQRKTDTTGYELQQGHHEKYNTQTTKTLQKKRYDSFTPHQHCTRNSDTPHTQTPKKWITIQNTTRIHKKINLNTQHHKTQKMKNHDTTAAARGGVQKRAIATSRQLARLHVSLYQPQGYALQRPLQG